MVDPERPQARRVQAGADRELGRSAFNHPTGVGDIPGARGVLARSYILHSPMPLFSVSSLFMQRLHIDRGVPVIYLFSSYSNHPCCRLGDRWMGGPGITP
jgi:hypothetical protein